MNRYIFLVFLIVSLAFASEKDGVVTKKIYPNISKDAIFNASKMLFSLSNEENGNKDFIINSYRDKLEIEKIIFQNKIIKVDLLLDKWTLEVHELDNESRVNLLIQRSDAINLDDKKELDINIHNMFWDRLDYLLGLSDTWKSCESYFSMDLNTYNCYNFLLNDKPSNSLLSSKISISEKNKNFNTIDTIKADIFEKTDLYLEKKNNDILEQGEQIEDILSVNILTPIMQNSILETKAQKSIKTQDKDKDKDKDNLSTEEKEIVAKEMQDNNMQNSDESITKFKDNMKDIVNMKNSLNDKDIEKIITESNDLKENSEFSLETK